MTLAAKPIYCATLLTQFSCHGTAKTGRITLEQTVGKQWATSCPKTVKKGACLCWTSSVKTIAHKGGNKRVSSSPHHCLHSYSFILFIDHPAFSSLIILYPPFTLKALSSMPSKFPDDTRRPPGLSSAFYGRNDDHTNNHYTQEHAYASDSSSSAPSNFGNVGGQFSGSQASYSYGSDEFSNDATPNPKYPNYRQYPPSYSPDNSRSTQSFPNNGIGHNQQSLYNNHTQSYAHAPSQQFPPTKGQAENTTHERDAIRQQCFLPNPPDVTPPSPIPQSRDQTATTSTSHAQSLPVPATSLSSSDAPAIPKGRQSKATKPAAPKAAKKPAARGRRAAPKASAAEQKSGQDNNSGLAAKVPAKRGPRRKAPLPEPSPAAVISAAVTQPVSGSANVQAPAAAQEKFKVASVDQSQAASASNAIVQSATQSSRGHTQPAGDQAFEASRSSTTLNKRKRDEQVDAAQRDRDLMPPPAAPRSNFSNGKGKGKAIEPPAPIVTNNQVSC